MNKVKKFLISIWGFLMSIPTRIYGATVDINRTPDLYGTFEPKPSFFEIILNALKYGKKNTWFY